MRAHPRVDELRVVRRVLQLLSQHIGRTRQRRERGGQVRERAAHARRRERAHEVSVLAGDVDGGAAREGGRRQGLRTPVDDAADDRAGNHWPRWPGSKCMLDLEIQGPK